MTNHEALYRMRRCITVVPVKNKKEVERVKQSLETDIEKFLASGGQIKEIPAGVSAFPDLWRDD